MPVHPRRRFPGGPARCPVVVVAGDGGPAVASVQPRPIAITGERAAGSGRAPESWEHVMPWGESTEDRRLPAAGCAVRAQVPVAGGRS
ncbi:MULTISPECIES: hypothetical protein [unclassified Blastococcus]